MQMQECQREETSWRNLGRTVTILTSGSCCLNFNSPSQLFRHLRKCGEKNGFQRSNFYRMVITSEMQATRRKDLRKIRSGSLWLAKLHFQICFEKELVKCLDCFWKNDFDVSICLFFSLHLTVISNISRYRYTTPIGIVEIRRWV